MEGTRTILVFLILTWLVLCFILVFALIVIRKKTKARSIQKLISDIQSFSNGSNKFEFVSTNSINGSSGNQPIDLLLQWIKSVIAFGNSGGGYIVFGMDDSGNVSGIEVTGLSTNKDFNNFVKVSLKKYVSPFYLKNYSLTSIPFQEKKLAVLKILSSNQRVHMNFNEKKHYFVRMDRATVEVPENYTL